ncbi:hypothetical protein [Parapedobacter sp. DT-150]|uniref:hypothetical protein n=1 Tax=Parapedobacter sp. DT-150 TaxID=3396162 RepID=UPI003F1C1FB4
MKPIASYPVFQADQVLTNKHLNNVLDYLDQQERLSRFSLIGKGIVCGLEITSNAAGISVSGGCGITAQGYLINHCSTQYTHYIPYGPPQLPDSLYLIDNCDEVQRDLTPLYGVQNDLWELVPSGAAAANQQALGNLDLADYVVVLLMVATQTHLKNCDTNDCNDKGSRMDFEVKPLLAKRSLIGHKEKTSFDVISLKRYNVSAQSLETPDEILEAFYAMTDDDTLDKLSRNIALSWDVYAGPLGLDGSNPLKTLDLKTIRQQFSSNNDNVHHIQYFYDFVDDLVKAYAEFKRTVSGVSGGCCPDEMDFPLHLVLGAANRTTKIGVADEYRTYFRPALIMENQRDTLQLAATLLQRLQAMVAAFDVKLLKSRQKIVITPNNLGRAPLSARCIPYYYHHVNLLESWNYRRLLAGDQQYNPGYHATVEAGFPEEVSKPLYFDTERYNAFRIEGHIGMAYQTALAEIQRQRQVYNLPFDIVALDATDLLQVIQGQDVTCIIEDLESDYNVLIAGLLCRLEQILSYVSSLRPQKPGILLPDIVFDPVLVRKEPLSTIVNTIKTDFKTGEKPASTVNYISKLVPTEKKDDNDMQLVDFLKTDLSEFLIKDRVNFEYLLPKPDLLLVFLQDLNKLLQYLFEHELTDFDEQAYGKLWDAYVSTVKEITASTATSNNAVLKEYFAAENYGNLLFKCSNEELFALLTAYRERLKRYYAAVNFNTFFRKHTGLEHKAGVPKGGTFVLVYYTPVPTKEIPSREVAAGRTVAGVATLKPTLKMSRAVDLIKELGLSLDDQRRLLDTIGREEEVMASRLKIPAGVVIADFYLPYLNSSNCPPLAYIFQEAPTKPEEPGEPEPPLTVTINMDQQTFCANDATTYPVRVSPEGGQLSVDGNVSQGLTIDPSVVGVGIHELVYTVGGVSAKMNIDIKEPIAAAFEIEKATFQNDGWEISFKSGIGDGTAYQWAINGKPAEAQAGLTALFTLKDGKAEVGLTAQNPPCANSEFKRTLNLNAITVDICGIRDEHRFAAGEGIILLEQTEGVKSDGKTIIIQPKAIFVKEITRKVITYYYPQEDGYVFVAATLTLVDAAFSVSFTTVDGGRIQVGLSALNVGSGVSTWLLNDSETKTQFALTAEELKRMQALVVVHAAKHSDQGCSDERKLQLSAEQIMQGLKENNNRFVVTA